MGGGWREERNDDTMEAVLSETDGGYEAAGRGESQPNKTGGEGGNERAKDFGDGERAAEFDNRHVDPRRSCLEQQG